MAPKREALKASQEELTQVQNVLDDARRRLAQVEQGIAALKARYEECVQKKEELEYKSAECSARLSRAEKVSSLHIMWICGIICLVDICPIKYLKISILGEFS